jgi:hypothetical protein
MGWISTYPLSSTEVSGSPDQKRTNFEGLEDWWDVEHHTFTSGDKGKHDGGRVSALYYGTQAEIDALTSPGTGAIAWATDKGLFELYRGSWEPIAADAFSRVRKYASSMSIPTNTTTTITTWTTAGTGTYDTLGEWASNKFTAKAAGYYLVTASTRWVYSSAACWKAFGLQKNGTTSLARSANYGTEAIRHVIHTVVDLNASDYLTLWVYHDLGSARDIYGADIHIQRIS